MSTIELADGQVSFHDLNLPSELRRAVEQSGYERATEIQAQTIPPLLAGRDVLGQAQTGTGKTAAFALPLLSRIEVEVPETQVLVLTPTRELAIQVAESFLKYGQHMRGLRVCPVYGGSSYATQIHALKRGAHVVVGTPGRIMDHMRESRLRVDMLQCLVLDEADEMLRMGFVEDVEWILQQTPDNRQIALFSATMPIPIRKIADRHLKNPAVVTVDAKQRTADTIQQRFLVVDPKHKLEALQRILEAEATDGVIVFVKTKIATVEVADQLRAMGYAAVALNGDIPQSQRERTIEQLKEGTVHILVATDVAARGLDVQRISHVMNYDLPADPEAYVHRVGRTGRAGRTGQAILFVTPKQRGAIRDLDKASGNGIEPMSIPTSKEINNLRETRFKERIAVACADAKAASFRGDQFRHFEKLIAQCAEEHELSVQQIAAGLAMLAQGDRPFFVSESADRTPSRDDHDRGSSKRERKRVARQAVVDLDDQLGSEMESFRVEVGRIHGVKPGNLVGAVANEIGLSPKKIGPIRIHHDFSTIDLPSGMPREAFKILGRSWVVGRQLRISKVTDRPRQLKPRGVSKGAKKRKP